MDLPGAPAMDDGDDDAVLDRILRMALESEHPAIDPEGVESMKAAVAGGKFPHAHYISMWTDRLVAFGVDVNSSVSALEQLAANGEEARRVEERTKAAAAAAERDRTRVRPDAHPHSLRSKITESELGEGYSATMKGVLKLLPYATADEGSCFQRRMRNAVTNPRDFAAFVETVKDAVKYYGMWRARFETDESREEYHFIDKDDAARQLEQAGHIFRTQVVAARRRDLAEGPRELSGQFKSASLGMNFEEIMYLLQEQMWGADDSSKSAFECAIRYGMADGTRFEGMVAAFENSKEEYGYRCAVLGSVQGPSPYHVIDPKECVSLFRQLRETFEMELDELTRRDFEGENVDGENDGDSEISDMQDMMDTLAPLDSDALLAVNSKTDEKAAAVDLAARDSRLGSWGGKYLVSDLYAQATWLRDHAGQGSESNDHAEITCTVYFLWLCGGFLTGAHWIYLANKGRAHWGNWHEDRGTIPTVSGPPPPPEIICGITGKVMQDPYTLRTAAVQGVAASTTNQKLFSCNHTFEGEALFKALSVERKCPRCGMKPFTASYRQSGVKALMQKSPSVGHVVDTWYIIQNLAPPSAPPPPSNVWPCLWHALLCWILVSSSIASRHLAFSMSTGCDGGQAVLANNSTGGTQGAVECTWDKQPASVSGLYMCHVFLGLGVLVTWISDGLSGRHVALQVMHLEKLTVLCTTNWSATWLVIGNAGITFLLFAGWQIVMSTRMS